MSAIINAGEGIDVDIHLHRENRSRTIDKVAQRIRLNRTKLKSLQDTSTDYEELTNSISAGYYIKTVSQTTTRTCFICLCLSRFPQKVMRN